MIIPPDPEKDPNVLTASSSTPSLLLSEADVSSPNTTNPTRRAPGYDDLGLNYTGDALPPYIPHMREIFHRGVTFPQTSRIIIPPSPPNTDLDLVSSPTDSDITPTASTSRLPFPTSTPSTSYTSSSHRAKSKRPAFILPPPLAERWKKHKKWIFALLLLILVGLGLMAGLLVGLRVGKVFDNDPGGGKVGYDQSPGRHSNWVKPGDQNMTYIPGRDGPTPSDGNFTTCPSFTLYNLSNPLSLLTAYPPSSILSITTFRFPLTPINSFLPNTTLISRLQRQPSTNTDIVSMGAILPPFFISAQGLGSSGTVILVGRNAPEDVLAGGEEGVVKVDVVVRYNGTLDGVGKVCGMNQGNGSVGLGIYTPKETITGLSNPYMLSPLSTPTFQVYIRLPPSLFSQSSPPRSPLQIPQFTLNLDRTSVEMGNLAGIVEFGEMTVNTQSGGVVGGSVVVRDVGIWTGGVGEGVRGRWNVSGSLGFNCTQGTILAEVILPDPPTPSLSTNTTAPTNHTATTRFMTSKSLLSVSYLYQSPNTTLNAQISNSMGEVNVDLHRNWVGVFGVKVPWGNVGLGGLNNTGGGTDGDRVRKRKMVMVDAGNVGAVVGDGLCLADGEVEEDEDGDGVADLGEEWVGGGVWWDDVIPGGVEEAVEGAEEAVGVKWTAEDVKEIKGAGSVAILGGWGNVRLGFGN